MQGQLPSGKDKGLKFAAIAAVEVKGGAVSENRGELVINGADECIIRISAATNYNIHLGATDSTDVVKKAKHYLDSARSISWQDAQKSSINAYQKLYNRCQWSLAGGSQKDNRTTQRRLIDYAEGYSDNQLAVLYFNFGRYLLISSSRPGCLPANLQGLWAEEYQTPWNGDYHLNINLQMNYWPAEVTNLSSAAQPLFHFIYSLVKNGEKTARAYYGARGWVAHVISNPWYYTSPGEGAEWGSTLTGGAWLCSAIYEHFRFTRDTSFLKMYYPVLKGSAQFLQSILIYDPLHDCLVTAPSNSPENTYIMPNGFKGNTCMGPTMDMQICREIFRACADAAEILKIDSLWSDTLKSIIPHLAPDKIGAAGDLNEWLDDWQDAEPHHRHVSHLYGLYPYDEISPEKTPRLAEAARLTLTQRGDSGTGWSMAWKVCFYARLREGNHALKLLKQLWKPTEINKTSSGTYPNLFCAHPPFQIDGNLGATAGIAEMLLQSNEGNIFLLPSLPDEWDTGKITGLCARGNFEVSMTWKNGRLVNADILSKSGGTCTIHYSGKNIPLHTSPDKHYKLSLNDFK